MIKPQIQTTPRVSKFYSIEYGVVKENLMPLISLLYRVAIVTMVEFIFRLEKKNNTIVNIFPKNK